MIKETYKNIKNRAMKMDKLLHQHSISVQCLVYACLFIDLIQVTLNFADGASMSLISSILLASPICIALDISPSLAADFKYKGKSAGKDYKREIIICWSIFLIGLTVSAALFYTSQEDFYAALTYVGGHKFELTAMHYAITFARIISLLLTSVVSYIAVVKDSSEFETRAKRKAKIFQLENAEETSKHRLALKELELYADYNLSDDVLNYIDNENDMVESINTILNIEYRQHLAEFINTPDATRKLEEKEEEENNDCIEADETKLEETTENEQSRESDENKKVEDEDTNEDETNN